MRSILLSNVTVRRDITNQIYLFIYLFYFANKHLQEHTKTYTGHLAGNTLHLLPFTAGLAGGVVLKR